MVADRDKAIFEDVTRDEKDRRIEELEGNTSTFCSVM